MDRLTAWPYSFSFAEIGRMTPRQVFRLLKRLHVEEEADEPAVVEPSAPRPERKKKEPEPAPERDPLPWLKYPCWQPYPGEDDNDPFSVPREVVKERWSVMVYESCHMGLLESHGVRKGDETAARDLFDRTWAENEKNFQKLKEAHDAESLHRQGDPAGRPDADRPG